MERKEAETTKFASLLGGDGVGRIDLNYALEEDDGL